MHASKPEIAARPMNLHQEQKEAILKSYFNASGFGLEIGLQARGLVPKRDGYNVKIADWYSTDELRSHFKRVPDVDEAKIEEVDYITAGKSLSDAIPERGVFDYIIASHVIEHVPDLVQFLKDCEALLRPSGCLVLAVPDKRFTFDVLRPLTSLGDVMQAHLYQYSKHPPGKILDYYAYAACRDGGYIWGPEHAGPLTFKYSMSEARRKFDEATHESDYIGMHGWTFVPASFRLLMNDLMELGEIGLLETAFGTMPPEFFIALSRTGGGCMLSRQDLAKLALEEWRIVT
jgi:SAM-dependent methyltransferase